MDFDFASSTSVPTLDKVPVDFRGLYVEKKEGDKTSYVLDTESPAVKSAVSAITGLNAALKKARADKPVQVDLSPLAEYGDNPLTMAEKVKATIDNLTQQIKGVDINKIKADLETPWKEKVGKAETRATKAEQSFHKRVVVGDVKSAVAGFRANELIIPFVLESCKVINNPEGELDVVVVDEAGAVRYSGATGNPMTPAERVAEMKGVEKFKMLFPSEAPRGGGAPPVQNRPNSVRAGGQEAGVLTPTQKITAGLSRGLASKGK